MNDAAVFIDVNLPMYATGRDHPYRESCVWVLSEITKGNLEGVIDTEIIQEVLYRYGALGRWETGSSMASSLLDLFSTVLPVTRDDMELALALFSEYGPQGIRARDVLHAAVMEANGIVQIISADRHYDRLPNIRRIDPQELYRSRSG